MRLYCCITNFLLLCDIRILRIRGACVTIKVFNEVPYFEKTGATKKYIRIKAQHKKNVMKRTNITFKQELECESF